MTSQIEAGAKDSIGAAVRATFESAGISGTRDPFGKSGRKFRSPGTYSTGDDADGRFVFVQNPSPAELLKSYNWLARELGDVAPFEVVASVYAHNPLSWWVLWRSSDETRAAPEMAGLAAYVPLNARGLAALRRGEFRPRDPDLGCVARAGEDPAALYLWGLVAHGLSDLAGKLVGHAIGLDVYEHLPMIGTIGTQEGLDALRRSTKSASDAAALKIGSIFEIRLPPKHIQHQREMRVWEG